MTDTVRYPWIEGAQQVVNVVAPMVTGQDRETVVATLDQWLHYKGATLPEPFYGEAVEAITSGMDKVLIIPAP